MEDQKTEFSQTESWTDDRLNEMLELAESLKAANGGALDDAAVYAVSEATGTPVDVVRVAAKLRSDQARGRLGSKIRDQFITLDEDLRRFVASGLVSSMIALFSAVQFRLDDALKAAHGSGSGGNGIPLMIALAWLVAGLYNIVICREGKVAAISGAILSGGFFFALSLFEWVLGVQSDAVAFLILPVTLGGALGGWMLQKMLYGKKKLGLSDPIQERQDLLRQLVSIQERLRSGEQIMTFLSIDIVGSTRMKESADPLAIEFTFNEYHGYVKRLSGRHGGTIHSTAGDGVTVAFEHPVRAFAAARNIQTGLIELNTFRNQVGVPIVLRQAVHAGKVVAPKAGDAKSVNFAHVIDLAAHLQKITPPGCVAISEPAAQLIPGGCDSIGQNTIHAEGISAFVWKPKTNASAVSASKVPAPPV